MDDISSIPVGHNIQVLKNVLKLLNFKIQNGTFDSFRFELLYSNHKYRLGSFQASIKFISVLGNASDKKMQKLSIRNKVHLSAKR